jgi:hypothetical protein
MNKKIRDMSKFIAEFGSSYVAIYAMSAILSAACPIVGIPATLGCMAISATVGDKVGEHMGQKVDRLFNLTEDFKTAGLEEGDSIDESEED